MVNEIKSLIMKYCRGCLTHSDNMKPIDYYSEFFSQLTGVEIVQDGSIFNWICNECLALIYQFDKFKTQVQKVDELLQKHLSSSHDSKQFDTLLLDENISNRKRLKSITLNALQICNECDANNDIVLSNNQKIDCINEFSQIDTKSTFNNSLGKKIVKIFSYEHKNTNKDIKDELDMSDNERIDILKDLSDSDDEKRKIEETKQKKKTKKRCRNELYLSNENSSSENISVSSNVKKHKKREWINQTLDMKKIKVINLSLDEQMKETEDRKTSKDFCDARYKCEFCVKIFPYAESLENHMQRHNKMSGCFICSICQQRFKEKRVLKNHFNTHSRRYQCLKCGKILHFKTTMANHLLRHENMYICQICGHHSKNKESNKKHQKTHSTTETFKCSICPKVLNNKHDYGVHIRRHTGDMPFTCSECGKCFQTGATLAAHKSVHSTAREFYCASCDVSFKTREIMLAHLRKSAKHVDPALLIYPCDQCKKKFESEAQRAAHIDSYHVRSVQLFCDVCPARFVSANGLRNHRRRKHEGLRPTLAHVCETCGRGFSTKALVTNHLRTHTGERPFECETCHRCFSQKSAMQTHIKLVHLKLKRNRNKQSSNSNTASMEKPQFEQSEHWLNPVIM